MTWHAVDALDRAVDATRRLLFPFEAVRWAKLAFLALVMAGGGTGASWTGSSSLGGSTGGIGAWSEFAPTESESVPAGIERVVSTGAERLAGLDVALLAGIAVSAALGAVALVACSIAFRLAFYDALATNQVALWRPFRDRFRQALGLLAVSTLLAVATGISVLALVVAVDPAALRAVGVSLGGFPGSPTIASVALGAFGVTAFGAALFGTVGSRLTFEFIAPAMVARDVGVLAGWRAVWASLRDSWSDVVAYLVVHAVLTAGVRILQAVAVALVGGLVAVTALVALLLAAVPLGGVEALFGTTAGAIALAAVLVCAVVAVVVATLPVRLVARAYLTAYEVSTLAGIDPDLAPLASTLVARDESEPIGE